jgi:hypothetical protein
VITFEIPTLGGSPTIATLQWTGMRLCAGLFAVHDTSGAGLRAFTGFRGRARRMAQVMHAEELEIQGMKNRGRSEISLILSAAQAAALNGTSVSQVLKVSLEVIHANDISADSSASKHRSSCTRVFSVHSCVGDI